jgi:coenzyme Q-binding protein COQ10
MPTVSVQEHLNAPIAEVWRLICDVETYPHLMEPVKRLQIISEADGQLVTAWEVELKGSLLCWTQDEVHDRSSYRITYEQREGDLELFRGHWQLAQAAGEAGTIATLLVEFEIGIPMLRDMLNPVAERALRENSVAMLKSLDRAPTA